MNYQIYTPIFDRKDELNIELINDITFDTIHLIYNRQYYFYRKKLKIRKSKSNEIKFIKNQIRKYNPLYRKSIGCVRRSEFEKHIIIKHYLLILKDTMSNLIF